MRRRSPCCYERKPVELLASCSPSGLSQLLSAAFLSRSEIDSELLDDKTQVLGVLAADDQGLCVLAQGDCIDSSQVLANIASSLAKLGSRINAGEEQPTIVLESSKK